MYKRGGGKAVCTRVKGGGGRRGVVKKGSEIFDKKNNYLKTRWVGHGSVRGVIIKGGGVGM